MTRSFLCWQSAICGQDSVPILHLLIFAGRAFGTQGTVKSLSMPRVERGKAWLSSHFAPPDFSSLRGRGEGSGRDCSLPAVPYLWAWLSSHFAPTDFCSPRGRAEGSDRVCSLPGVVDLWA